MLVNPKAILAAAKHATEAVTRYALDTIRFERRKDRVLAIATNGKSLIVVSEEEKISGAKTGDSLDLAKSTEFKGVNLPVSTVVGIAKGIKCQSKDKNENRKRVGIEESSAGKRAWLEYWDKHTQIQTKVSVDDRNFPPFESVIPKVSQDTHAAVILDVDLLISTLQSIKLAAKRDRYDRRMSVTIFFHRTKADSSAVLFAGGDHEGDGLRVASVLMPVSGADEKETYRRAEV